MKISKLSRGPDIDIEKCVKMVDDNRFNLVLIASIRARELSRQHKHDEKKSQLNAPVQALLDIQEGRVGVSYLKKIR
jgi:DNA-directed RNA polymerase omega subunit